jgi:hypothetical protein
MSAKRNNLMETIQPLKRVASTDFNNGEFVMSNGAGKVLPLDPANVVAGLNLQDINSSTTPNYAVAEEIMCDTVIKTVDRFLVDVTGTATALMEGRTFDISSGDSGVISVAAVSLVYGTLTGVFAAGEIVQVTSGSAEGSKFVVVADNGSTTMTLQALDVIGSGKLDVAVTLLGLTSGATAAVASAAVQLPTQFKLEQFISATLCEFSVLRTQ